jgi:hypothetical protein
VVRLVRSSSLKKKGNVSEKEIHQHDGSQHSESDGTSVEDTPIVKGRSIAEHALLYIGIPAITLYPLGLLTLAIQLCLDPSFPICDFATVWTSVSLIPETTVIGTGVYFAYLSLVATPLGMGVASLILTVRHLSRGPGREGRPEGDRPRGLEILRDGFRSRGRRHWWSTYLLILLPIAVFMGLPSIVFDQRSDAWYLAGFILFNVGAGIVLAYMRVQHRKGTFLTEWVPAYVAAVFAASLCLAVLHPPDLPVVEAQTADTSSEGPGTPNKDKFVFLTQSGPYWYVYNEDGLFSFQVQQAEFVGYTDIDTDT